MKYALIITFLLIITPLALADNHTQANESTQYCTYLTQEIGMEVGDEVPGVIPYKNEQVALFDLQGNEQGRVITSQGEVTAVDCQPLQNATYHVSIASTETIDAIFYSEKPLGELDNQKADKNIVVQGQTMGKQLKKSFAFAGVKILSWFGL